MHWLEIAIAALNAIPNWLPVLTSFGATVVAILAYFRSVPPILPKAWIEVKGRGSQGASLLLHVQNHTNWLVQLRGLRVEDHGVELSMPKQPVFDKDKPWHLIGQSDYEWTRSLKLDVPVAPNGSVEFPFAMRLSESISCTKPSMHLSISTTRRVVRQRTMVIPTIVPKHNDASSQ